MARRDQKGSRPVAPPINLEPSHLKTESMASAAAALPRNGSPSTRQPPPFQNFSRPRVNHSPDTITPPPRQRQPPSNGSAHFGRPNRADEASPSSPSDDSTDSDSSDSESPPLSTSPESPYQIPRRPMMMRVDSPPPFGGDSFEVADCGNFDPMDSDREDALKPYAIEYAESDRSRSRSRTAGTHRRRTSLDPQLMEKFKDVNCGPDSDSDEEYDCEDADFQEFIRQQKENKWRNRMSHGSSIGKRTISERGSDSDREDLISTDGRDGHMGDRRTRRRVERRSGLFADGPPPERIPELPELEEPDTDDEVDLARELPFCDTDLEIMEVDSETDEE